MGAREVFPRNLSFVMHVSSGRNAQRPTHLELYMTEKIAQVRILVECLRRLLSVLVPLSTTFL